MIKISKKEKDYLESQGYTFGTGGEGVLHKTVSGYGKKTTYYLTEEPDQKRWDYKQKKLITVKKGALAPNAAGVIHTDFERGFIRAEVVSYTDYVSCNGETGAKEQGKLRSEGKNYVMQDGDVVHFLFNV